MTNKHREGLAEILTQMARHVMDMPDDALRECVGVVHEDGSQSLLIRLDPLRQLRLPVVGDEVVPGDDGGWRLPMDHEMWVGRVVEVRADGNVSIAHRGGPHGPSPLVAIYKRSTYVRPFSFDVSGLRLLGPGCYATSLEEAAEHVMTTMADVVAAERAKRT